MTEIKVYTTNVCPYCTRAKELLKSKGATYEEISVESDKAREELIQMSGRRTVPQIYIGDRHVGGFDDLKSLNDSGELDSLLEASNH